MKKQTKNSRYIGITCYYDYLRDSPENECMNSPENECMNHYPLIPCDTLTAVRDEIDCYANSTINL